MLELSPKKHEYMERIAASDELIKALAIDQRGSINKMISEYGVEPTQGKIEQLKKIVSEELTPYASSILLDPLYGLPAAEVRDQDAGLLLAYEETGYRDEERQPNIEGGYSVQRLIKHGAEAVKLLLYYDPDETNEVNNQKLAFIERVGSECENEDIPHYLEILTYDKNIQDTKSADFAKVKPKKVIESMTEFSKPQYKVDVLKMETPVNMNFVEGFTNNEVIYSQDEAAQYFKEQSDATDIPYIFLSAGVSAKLFQQTLEFAANAGAEFHGVLCGRATWKGVIEPFVKQGEEAAREWLRTIGKKNQIELNQVIERTATPWTKKLKS
jgi:tagatose 1,6-diphosphate aldolase